MTEMTIGIIIIVISILGYISNWLNWRFLNYKINYLLYYFGAFIHETSHALLCLLTGAKISEYKVLVDQPRVSYSNSKIPILGNLLIAIAPIFGGLIVLYFVREYFFINVYHMPEFSDWKLLITDSLNFLKQINIFDWKNLATIFLFLNAGAMIGPSWQDLKNVWFLVILLIFIPWELFTHLGLLAISLILINIIFQIAIILIIYILKFLRKIFFK